MPSRRMTPVEYYSNHLDAIEEPTHMDQREFGWTRLGDDGKEKFIRHLQITSMSELWSLVMREYPLGLYCSNSRYRYPAAPMAEKQWISAELIFDIDGESPEKLPVDDLAKLLEALELDIGISKELVTVYFSGNKGFHIHVKECQYDKVATYGRHCIAQHIKSKGVALDSPVTSDIHRIFRMPGSLNNKSGQPKTKLAGMRHPFI